MTRTGSGAGPLPPHVQRRGQRVSKLRAIIFSCAVFNPYFSSHCSFYPPPAVPASQVN